MSIKHRQSLRQKPQVSPQLVLANELLQFSSLELERAISHELAENPALELVDIPRCPHCGSDMPDAFCSSCGVADPEPDEDGGDWRDLDSANSYGSSQSGDADEWEDPISRLASRMTLKDHVLHQARLSLPGEDALIAAHLIESIDDHGFLGCDLDEVAAVTGVGRGDVDRVLSMVQALDPPGVAARDARECLLIQMAHLRQEGVVHPLAECLIAEHWGLLGRCSPSRVAEEVSAAVDDVCAALSFIRESLHPYPAYTCWFDERDPPPDETVVCPEPDIIIRERGAAEGEYEIELPKAQVRRLRVRSLHCDGSEPIGLDGEQADQPGWDQWNAFRARGRLFVKSIEQRWETLYELAICLVDIQGDFLAHGEMHLKPLTRARVAEMMDVHESTVSRAVTGKHVQLPCGEVVPLEKFFDSAAPIKRVIEDLVNGESVPLSDGAIAEELCDRGFDVARRTVAKYRNALGILPSSLRRRRHDGSP